MEHIWFERIKNTPEIKNDFDAWIKKELVVLGQAALSADNIEKLCNLRGRSEILFLILKLINQQIEENPNA